MTYNLPMKDGKPDLPALQGDICESTFKSDSSMMDIINALIAHTEAETREQCAREAEVDSHFARNAGENYTRFLNLAETIRNMDSGE